jgi:hypothetical protein
MEERKCCAEGDIPKERGTAGERDEERRLRD